MKINSMEELETKNKKPLWTQEDLDKWNELAPGETLSVGDFTFRKESKPTLKENEGKKEKAVTENTANVAAEDQSSTDLVSENGSSDYQKNKKPIVSREDFKLEEDEFIKKVSEKKICE